MQADFIRDFFNDVFKYIAELEKYISEDNILYSQNYINKIESTVKTLRKKLKVAFRDLLQGKKHKEYMASDEL